MWRASTTGLLDSLVASTNEILVHELNVKAQVQPRVQLRIEDTRKTAKNDDPAFRSSARLRMTTQDLMRKLNEAEQEEEAGETEKTPEPAAAETAGSEDPENVQHRQSSTEPTTESPSNQTQVAPTVPQPEATKAPAKPGSSACECQERLSSVLYRTLLVPAETFDWNYALSWNPEN
ncbi:hypothetical protein HFD88_007041 [Aspergillus terreus]|nr:hypothetical protein HFD88_007041 [Aspergillus terreus]